MLPPSELRCHAMLPDAGRCARASVADGWCGTHHPLRDNNIVLRRRSVAMARRVVLLGMHDFWCQIAIAALIAYLQKTALPAYEALREKCRLR